MKKIFIVLVLAGLMFAGCKGSISIYTYTSDLIEVAENDDVSMTANVNIVIQGLKEPEDIDFLRNNLNIFKNEKKVEIEYSDSLSFDTEIKIIPNIESINVNEKDLLCIKAKENKDGYEYKVVYNYEILKKIKKYIETTHYQEIEFKDFEIKLTIDNDIKSIKQVVAYSVYVNEKPYPLIFSKNIARREKIELKFSEILRNEISNNETIYPNFIIKKSAD